jgi:hypothetical protein
LRRPAALLLVLALLAGPLALRGEEKKPENPRLRKALEQSLLFPGLGQLYEKQYAKAAFFAAAEIFCLAQVALSTRKGNDAYRNYRDARDIASAVEWRGQTRMFDRRRNIAILAAAGVWVLNMVDIFVHAKKKYGREKSLALHPFYHHESHAVGAGVTCRF